ncbi:nucleotide-binding protein [Moraxella osloensis]|mgnify:CR=1 FL=1|uniref:Nucleotide-binding protein n=2 Tax=Faucicola osloensis TaxID=34062 RepID=A0A2I1RGB1_FAUOS|nr:nucleotide-binding protein [Moraxella osloensis]
MPCVMSGKIMQLIDTNIIIYYLNGNPKISDFFKNQQGQIAISMITVAEILSYPYDEMERAKIERFLKNRFIWFDVTEMVVFKTGRLRGQKKIKTPDAIIASTALCHNLTLVTRNIKDFDHLPLILVNPID